MSSKIKYINNSGTDVIFAMSNGPAKHVEKEGVKANDTGKSKLDNSDLRICSVWQSENLLYPNSKNPSLAFFKFVSDQEYTITLSSDGVLSVSEGNS